MESYQEFLNRIDSFEKAEMDLGDHDFNGSAGLYQKVDADNHFLPFYGDTVVFNLDDLTKEKLAGIADRLYAAAGECFCDRLAPDTFHMTLHDLSNSPVLEHIAADVFRNELCVVRKAKQVSSLKIRMKSKFIFNMVHTSLVLGLYPADEAHYHQLMRLYELFDDVKHLDYPLTPHITLGYYSIHGFGPESARRLERVVKELNENAMEIELDTQELFYQKFTSMNDYINIIRLAETGK